MKHKFSFFKYLIVLVLAGVFTGCSQDDDFLIAPPTIAQGEQQLQDTLTMGEELLLSPKFSNTKNSTFEWTVDGEVVGNDSTYVFTPETRGTHEISVQTINERGEASLTYDIHSWGAYENGFYLINEGWFGHGTGTIGFYRYDTQQIEDSVYVKTNPNKDFLPINSTLEFGTVYKEKLYLLSKVGGPVVVANAFSLKEEQRIASQPGNDWRAFLGISATKGLLSSSDGIHNINLETLQIEGKIPGISGQVGDMEKVGDYIFVLSQREGAVIFNATSYEIEKRIPGMVLGFAKTADNNIWVAGDKKLIKINPNNLETEEIELGFSAYGSWGAWHPSSITASDKAVFIAKNGSFSGGKEIYKYEDDVASLEKAFIQLPENEVFYGKGLAYNPDTNQLIIRTVREGWGENFSYNKLHFYNTTSGNLDKTESYEGYYFPAAPVFH